MPSQLGLTVSVEPGFSCATLGQSASRKPCGDQRPDIPSPMHHRSAAPFGHPVGDRYATSDSMHPPLHKDEEEQ